MSVAADSQRGEPLVSLLDYERVAARMLDPGALAYYAGGAGDERTLRDNVEAWQRLALVPRMLVGVGERSAGVSLLGRPRPNPLVVAPMALQRLAHREGEVGTARAAAAAGAVMCLSTLASTGPDALAEAVPEVARWFQLYVFADRGVTRELVARVVEHGYEALVVTVDLPILGVRERELRLGVHAPADAVTSAQAAGAEGMMTPAEFTRLIDPNLTWADIAAFADACALPVIVKGILTPQDARRAVEHGARGVVVSNHGGRQLDTVLAGADALPAVVDEVGGEIDVLVDGGIRRGTDVVKALALGASAVMIGRPLLWGLAVAGPEGATHVLQTLLEELDVALALAGAPRAAELDRGFVTRAPWVGPTR